VHDSTWDNFEPKPAWLKRRRI